MFSTYLCILTLQVVVQRYGCALCPKIYHKSLSVSQFGKITAQALFFKVIISKNFRSEWYKFELYRLDLNKMCEICQNYTTKILIFKEISISYYTMVV